MAKKKKKKGGDHVHGIFQLALVERLDLTNIVHRGEKKKNESPKVVLLSL